MAYFPMFVELQDRPCLVAGGGSVALRKIKILLDFGARVTVVSPEIHRDIHCLGQVKCTRRRIIPEDFAGMTLVVAATDNEEENRRIYGLCRKQGIPVNVVDEKEECDFIFPAYIRQGEVVAAFSSGGQSPAVAQYLKSKNEVVVTEELGQISALLGSLREEIKRRVRETNRKKLYEDILGLWLLQGRMPEEAEIREMIAAYEREEKSR